MNKKSKVKSIWDDFEELARETNNEAFLKNNTQKNIPFPEELDLMIKEIQMELRRKGVKISYKKLVLIGLMMGLNITTSRGESKDFTFRNRNGRIMERLEDYYKKK